MTFIAFHAQRDRADVLTDTGAYKRGDLRHYTDPKLVTLPGVGAVVVTQGSATAGQMWRHELALLAERCDSYDEMARRARTVVRGTWERLRAHVDANEGPAATLAPSVAFFIGYSAKARRYVAYGLASDHGFARMELNGLHVMPSPLDVRPGAIELQRLGRHFREFFDDATPVDRLRRLPKPMPPADAAGWVSLAERVREDRAMAPIYSGFKTYVSGDVVHTALTPSGVAQSVLHTYDDGPEETARMYAGTLHPASQAAPCDCGSSARFVDCCLTEIADEPCPCGSSRVFRDCCSVDAPSEAPAEQPVLVSVP